MAMPDVDAEVKVTNGTLSNLDALQNGSVDVAFSYADVAYATYVGGPGDQRTPFTGLRALVLLQLLPVQFVVSDRSPVRDVTDLPGRKVIFVGGGTNLPAERILRAYGVDPKSILLQQTRSFRGLHRGPLVRQAGCDVRAVAIPGGQCRRRPRAGIASGATGRRSHRTAAPAISIFPADADCRWSVSDASRCRFGRSASIACCCVASTWTRGSSTG